MSSCDFQLHYRLIINFTLDYGKWLNKIHGHVSTLFVMEFPTI